MSCALRSRAVALHERDRHVALHDAAADAADAHQADVGVVVEARHLQLQRPFELDGRRRHVVDDGFEQRLHVAVARGGIAWTRSPSARTRRSRESRAACRSRRAGRRDRTSDRAPTPAREPSRSILLMTTSGVKPCWNALLVTNRVCGIGPSTASTSSSTPSTIDSTRSTSPPKSACPGVSTMLMRQSRQLIAVFFARIVMPRSFSRSFESMARSGMTDARIERAGLTQQLIDERGLAVIHVRDDRDVSQPFLGQHDVGRGRGKGRALYGHLPGKPGPWRAIRQAGR